MVLPQRSRSVLCFLERCVINPRTPTGFKGKSTFANRLLYYSHTVYEAIISWFNNYLLTRIKLTFCKCENWKLYRKVHTFLFMCFVFKFCFFEWCPQCELTISRWSQRFLRIYNSSNLQASDKEQEIIPRLYQRTLWNTCIINALSNKLKYMKPWL